MSNRMCADCKNVVSNTCYHGDDCPKCKSTNWASPLDHNNEWELLRKAQIEILELKWELVCLADMVETLYPREKMNKCLIEMLDNIEGL